MGLRNFISSQWSGLTGYASRRSSEIPADALDDFVKEVSAWLAKHSPEHLDSDFVRLLAEHPWMVNALRGIRVFIPNTGPWKPLNEFVSDFFKRFSESVQVAHRKAHSPEDLERQMRAATADLQDDVQVLGRVVLAVESLDKPVRDQFNFWLNSPQRRKRFIELVRGKNPDEIKQFASLDPDVLDNLISEIKEPAPKLDFLTLRLAADTDPTLKKLLEDDLAVLNAKGPNQTIQFWLAVERAVESGKIKSMDEFKDIMKLPPPEAFKYLGFKMREKGIIAEFMDLRKQSTAKYADARLVKWSEEFRKGPAAKRR